MMKESDSSGQPRQDIPLSGLQHLSGRNLIVRGGDGGEDLSSPIFITWELFIMHIP